MGQPQPKTCCCKMTYGVRCNFSPTTPSLSAAKVSTLDVRRSALCARLFRNMTSPSHKINTLVPPRRTSGYNLRCARSFEVPKCRTERYRRSFIPSAVVLYDIS